MTDYWATATRVCTPRELAALQLRDRHGYTTARIAMTLAVSRRSIRDRLDNADRKIAAALNQPNDQEAA